MDSPTNEEREPRQNSFPIKRGVLSQLGHTGGLFPNKLEPQTSATTGVKYHLNVAHQHY